MKSNYACGVDIGGSHLTAALIDLTSSCILPDTIRRSGIDASAGADDILNDWAHVIAQVLSLHGAGPLNIGIAMPGPFDYENGISYIKGQHKYESLYTVNVKNRLAEALKQPAHTITFANDAACFLQGEVAGGIAAGMENVMGFTLGTGLGSAIFTHGIAEDADLWHSPFLDGIAEDYISSRWFVSRYYQLSQQPVSGVKEMVQRYAGDSHVRDVFAEFGVNLGRFLCKAVEGKDIQMIVLGGNISQALELFKEGIEKELARVVPVPRIRSSKLNEHAALLGAVSINTLITAL